jgi:hypothetical protein
MTCDYIFVSSHRVEPVLRKNPQLEVLPQCHRSQNTEIPSYLALHQTRQLYLWKALISLSTHLFMFSQDFQYMLQMISEAGLRLVGSPPFSLNRARIDHRKEMLYTDQIN